MKLGVSQLWWDLRHRRHRFRQPFALLFCLVLLVVARPVLWGFVVGAPLCLLGALVRLWAAGYVRKSKVLETRGPYSLVRHPQYLGNTLMATGASLAVGQPLAIALWAVLFPLSYVPAIRREDAKLHKRFGLAWEKWSAVTPAVVPLRRIPPGSGLHLKEWSLRQCCRNGEPIWLVLALVGLTYIFLAGRPAF